MTQYQHIHQEIIMSPVEYFHASVAALAVIARIAMLLPRAPKAEQQAA
jgi:hypothetical protein